MSAAANGPVAPAAPRNNPQPAVHTPSPPPQAAAAGQDVVPGCGGALCAPLWHRVLSAHERQANADDKGLDHFSNSLVQVSTFAGGFALNSLLTLGTVPHADRVSNLLAIASTLFSLSLFLAIYARMFLVAPGLKSLEPGSWVKMQACLVPIANVVLIVAGWLCLAGCITYGVIVVTVKLPDVGIAFIALTAGISLIFTFFAFLGLCLRLRIPNAPATKVDANAVVGNSAGPIPRPV